MAVVERDWSRVQKKRFFRQREPCRCELELVVASTAQVQIGAGEGRRCGPFSRWLQEICAGRVLLENTRVYVLLIEQMEQVAGLQGMCAGSESK